MGVTRTSIRAGVRARLVLLLGGLIAGLICAELVARMAFERGEGPFAHNPIIQSQAQQVDLFESDSELGHRLNGGGFVGVYERGLISLDQITKDQRRVGRTVVLNLGDSSTSGWDSNVIVGNALRHRDGKPLKSPFQNYPTYSDVLGRNPSLYVINAGIPGFSSLQGRLYLTRLLSEFRRVGVRIDLITIYFGNNDSAWNGNVSDRYSVPRGGSSFQLVRILDQATSRWRIVPRVRPEEYREHLGAMAQLGKQTGARVLFIQPVVPRAWPPGLRATGLEAEVQAQLERVASQEVGRRLRHAQVLYAQGNALLHDVNGEQAKVLLDEALENDFLVPRIKIAYATVLQDVARNEGVDVVSVAGQLPVDDSRYFIDYCHPIEPANVLIAAGIEKALLAK